MISRRSLPTAALAAVAALALLAPTGRADGGVPPSNTVRPALSGTAIDRQTLTTTTGTWTGTPPISFAFQWVRCDPVTWACSSIGGATAQSYTLAPSEVGFKVYARVTASNAAGQASERSWASATIAPAPPRNTALPALSGMATSGQTLTTSTGSWTGTPPLAFAFQWVRCDPVTWACSSIGGATAQSYTLAPSEVGFKVYARVTASNAAGQASARTWASAIVTAPPPAPPPAVLFVAPNGSDSNACTQAAPCLSFSRAYELAKLGDTVQVAGGTYGPQTMKTGTKPGPLGTCSAWTGDYSSCITFRPAPGAAVQMQRATIQVSFVRLDSITLTGQTSYDGLDIGYSAGDGCTAAAPHDVVAKNIDSVLFFVGGSDYVSILGGVYHGLVNDASKVKGCGVAPYLKATHGVIDGITIRDYTQSAAGVHMECVHFQSGEYWRITDSRFLNCAQYDLSIQTFDGNLPISDLTIENNVFDVVCSHQGPPCGSVQELNFGGVGVDNILVRFNTIYGGLGIDYSVGSYVPSNVVADSNIASAPSNYKCTSPSYYGSATRLSYNTWVNDTGNGVNCGMSGQLVSSFGFVDPADYDFRLKTGASAIDRGNPSSFPAADIYGTPRPRGSAPDAGSHEAA